MTMNVFERVWEQVTHWSLVGVLFAGVFGMMTFVIMAFWGPLVVELGAPIGALKRELGGFLYGSLSVVTVHVATRGWFFKEMIKEFFNLDAMHKTELSRTH